MKISAIKKIGRFNLSTGMIILLVLAGEVSAAIDRVQFVNAPESAALHDNAQGILMLGDKKIDISFAAGALSTSFGKTRAYIYLANDPIDPFSRELQGKVERGEIHYVEIVIDEAGSIIGFNLSSNVLNNGRLMGLAAASVQLETKQFVSDRITGKVFTEQPVLTSSLEIRIDADFSAALLQIGAKRLQREEMKTAEPAAVQRKFKTKPVWVNAKAVMDEVLQFTGKDVQPVYFMFSTVGTDSLSFHYRTGREEEGIKTIEWSNGTLLGSLPSALAQPCPSFPLAAIDFDLVPAIFDQVSRKVERGYNISVTLGRRRSTEGCGEPEWQGTAQYLNKMMIICYSIDGKETSIKEYSY
jgi:hypothetical protein